MVAVKQYQSGRAIVLGLEYAGRTVDICQIGITAPLANSFD